MKIHFQWLDKLEIYIKPWIDPMSILSKDLVSDLLDEDKSFNYDLAEKIWVFDEYEAAKIRLIDRNEWSGVYRYHEIILKGQDWAMMKYGVECVRTKVQGYSEAVQVKLTTWVVDPETGWYKPLTFAALAVLRGQRWEAIDTYSKLVIYGSMFARFWMELTRAFIDTYIVPDSFGCVDESRSPICRIDVCADINVWKCEVDAKNKAKPRSEIQYVKEIGAYETTYFWSSTCGKMMRIYDKVRDTFARGKNDLYPYLANTWEWTRIEVEFYPFMLSDPKNVSDRKQYAWASCDIDSVFDKYLIRSLMLGYVRTKNLFLHVLNPKWEELESQWIRYETKEVVKLSLDQLPKQYISQTRWLLKRINDMCGMEWITFVMGGAISEDYSQLIWEIARISCKLDPKVVAGILASCIKILESKVARPIRKMDSNKLAHIKRDNLIAL